MLDQLLNGPATEAAVEGQLPVFVFSCPEHETAASGRSNPYYVCYEDEPALTPQTFHLFLSFCYGQKLELAREVSVPC